MNSFQDVLKAAPQAENEDGLKSVGDVQLFSCFQYHEWNFVRSTCVLGTYLPTQDMHECIETYTISRFTN